jgi:hypothetical protein
MKTVFVIAATLTLLACSSTRQYSRDNPSRFQIGATTYEQVVDALGEPAESKRHPDGSRSIQYFHSASQAKAESNIPFIGGFRGGSEVESSFVSMSFNKDGLLRHYSAVSGKTSTSAGLP